MDIITSLLNDPSVSSDLKRVLERRRDVFGTSIVETPEYISEQVRKNLHMRAMLACAETKKRE